MQKTIISMLYMTSGSTRPRLVSPIIAGAERRELRLSGMMWKTKTYAQATALPAIAAALALSSTPAWSQEVQPTAEPDPISIAPPPVVETAPVTTDAATDTSPATETATEAAAAPRPKAKATARSTASARKATPTRVASAAPVAEAAAAPTTAPDTAPPAPQPIVDVRPQAQQPAPAPEAAQPTLPVDETTLMLGGGALALLALGGGALAMIRRRRHEDDEMMVDQSMTIEPEPMPRHDVIHEEQPAIVAPSAFAWGKPQQADPMIERRRHEAAKGETWAERAYRGPSPENPSLSLRKRLKRAAFFDAREERVAAGRAERVDTDAGLPENVANDASPTTRERELELA